jgi:hypothetical protein
MGFITPLGPFISTFLEETSPYINRPNVKSLEETTMTSRKAISLLMGLLLVLFVSASALAADELYGTWQLVSWKRTIVSTGETSDVMGKAPKGYVTYGRDGRVLCIMVSDKRPNVDVTKMTDKDRVELYNTIIAYTGTYNFDGKTLKIKVDISWNESWNGTVQVRTVNFEGNRMIHSAEPTIGALDGKLRKLDIIWERVK